MSSTSRGNVEEDMITPDHNLRNVNAAFLRFWVQAYPPVFIPTDPNDSDGVELVRVLNHLTPLLFAWLSDDDLVAVWQEAVTASQESA